MLRVGARPPGNRLRREPSWLIERGLARCGMLLSEALIEKDPRLGHSTSAEKRDGGIARGRVVWPRIGGASIHNRMDRPEDACPGANGSMSTRPHPSPLYS